MEKQKSPIQSDEVDLGQVFSKIGTVFQNIGMGFMRFLARLRSIPIQNKFSFLAIIVSSVVIGLLYSVFLRKDYYESTMILNSGYFNKRFIESTMEKLNDLAGEEDKRGLAKTLMITDSVASNIIKFDVEQFLVETDSSHSFEITVQTYKPNVISGLQVALVSFLKSNDYIKKRIEINKTNLMAKKEKLLAESQKLDSLKSVIYSNYKSMAQQSRQGGSNNVILSERSVPNPIEVYNQDLSIYTEIESINRQLYIQPDFEVVDGFVEFTEPANISLFKLVVLSVLAGIVIAYLDVVLRQFNRYLANLQ